MSTSKDLEIKHYKRTTATARSKELVSELVVEGSATFEFLQKLEEGRRKRECVLTVDMRGKVPGACQQYTYNEKVFYLDDASHAIFERGLTENNGVFTVGTYEEMVFGEHTTRAIRQRAEARAAQEAAKEPGAAPGKANAVAAKAPVARQPDVINFGYYRQRADQRLEIVTEVLVEIEGVRYQAKTRDLSRSGTQIYLPFVPGVESGSMVWLTFSDLQSQADVSLEAIPYVIVKAESKDVQIVLALRRDVQEMPDLVGSFFDSFIETSKRKYRLNLEDEVLSVVSLMYERIYAENALSVPLFIGRGGDGRLGLSYGLNGVNRATVDFFRVGHERYDLSPLCLPHRVEFLLELAQRQQGMSGFLVAYRDRPREQGGKISSFCSFEFDDASAFRDMLLQALRQKDVAVFQLSARPLQELRPRKLDLFLQQLYIESADAAPLLRERLGENAAIVSVQEVTDAARAALRVDVLASDAASEKGLIAVIASKESGPGNPVWTGHCRHLPGQDTTLEQYEDGVIIEPRQIAFGYLRRRAEERFLLQSEVELELRGQRVGGQTLDISPRGVGIVLNKAVTGSEGDIAHVSFTELQKLVSRTKLKNVPYEVRRLAEKGTVLGLVFAEDGNREVSAFFSEMIARNKAKLDKDLGDVVDEASVRVHESMFAENLMTVPFILMKEVGGSSLIVEKIALNAQPGSLVDFFAGGDGKFDYSCLTDTHRTSRMAIEIRSQQHAAGFTKPAELILLLERVGGPQGSIKVTTMRELRVMPNREVIIKRILDNPDHRVMRMAYWPIKHLNAAELDSLVEPVAQHSRAKAQQLREDVGRIQGVGEMLDITGLFEMNR